MGIKKKKNRINRLVYLDFLFKLTLPYKNENIISFLGIFILFPAISPLLLYVFFRNIRKPYKEIFLKIKTFRVGIVAFACDTFAILFVLAFNNKDLFTNSELIETVFMVWVSLLSFTTTLASILFYKTLYKDYLRLSNIEIAKMNKKEVKKILKKNDGTHGDYWLF